MESPSVCLVVGEYMNSEAIDGDDGTELSLLFVPMTCPMGWFVDFGEDVYFVANGEWDTGHLKWAL